MLETVDFSEKDLRKKEYNRRHDELVERLVLLQQQARQKGIGLVVLFEGWNGAGKGSRISDLMFNLDARATSVHVTENMDMGIARTFTGFAEGVTGYYPLLQQFWSSLGERGTITFYDRGWYTTATQYMLYEALGGLKMGKKDKPLLDGKRLALARRCLGSIEDFERQLADDGYVVVKFFVHITEQGQKDRLNKLHDDPATRWRVSDDKLSRIGNYKQAYEIYEKLLANSDYSFAPWTLLNGENPRQTNIAVAQRLVSALESAVSEHDRLEEVASSVAAAPCAPVIPVDISSSLRFAPSEVIPTLDEVDHSLALDSETYKAELKRLQSKLFTLENEMYQRRVPLMLMYEGWDAAGKGGNIKRVAQALDARAYNIFPSPAPTKPELMHPHLWRYWTRLPKAGHVGIYDRSWYGRVLVERVEGFATREQWERGYEEINQFENDLLDWGAILLKFWVEVSPEEQLRRFEDRQSDPAKQWKITDDDWRNREKYPQYKAAVEDMFRLTSTARAPWVILESDDKRYARIKALRIIVDALEARLR